MLTQYPNIQLLEYIFRQQINGTVSSVNWDHYDVDAYVFPQTWPNTGGGFSEPGYCYGDAMTKQYTTVLISHKYDVAMVSFGDKPAYIVTEASKKPRFQYDLKNCSMARKYDAEQIY